MDGDREILEVAKKRLSGKGKVHFINRDLSHINSCIPEGVSGVLFDLGVSSYHLEESGRGFSFEKNEELDMRYDASNGIKASDVLNNCSPDDLVKIFKDYGNVRRVRSFVDFLVRVREKKKITTSGDLAGIIKEFYGKKWIPHAARVFMALRIAVNDELGKLKRGLDGSLRVLKKGGRLVVISYHSSEDKVVKTFFRNMKEKGIARIITKKVIKPGRDEIIENPRARSARMRVLEKL